MFAQGGGIKSNARTVAPIINNQKLYIIGPGK